MESLPVLQKRIATTGKLQGIVKSMKTLAAVSIRQYERAVTSLDTYVATIEQGLAIGLREAPVSSTKAPGISGIRGVVAFGSDQGLCGGFNERLADFIQARLAEWQTPADELRVLVVGARVAARLEARGVKAEKQFWVPSSTAGVNPTVYQILLVLEQWQKKHQLARVELFHNRHQPGTAGEPVQRALLPLDYNRFRHPAGRYPGRCVPQFGAPRPALLSGLIRQYLFVSLFRAQAESLASEQASRLHSLQNAEKNIEEYVEGLQSEFRVKRQATITAELLDLVAGFRISTRRRQKRGAVAGGEETAS